MSMVNVVFITADNLRAVGQIALDRGRYPEELRRSRCPPSRFRTADAQGPETVTCVERRYRYVGKSSDSELHVYEELVP